MNAYQKIIERVFLQHYQEGSQRVDFVRDELAEAAYALGLSRPKNLGKR